jgi:ABC-2 type transport system ATP-binding protein
MAAMLGMENDIRRPVKKLSGGMRRKLEIIRGLMHRPRALFLDEPTAGLDVAGRRSLWDYLAEVRRTHETTIFLTTHNLEEAEQADRICILDQGLVVALGTPAEVKAQLLEERLQLDASDRAALAGELRALGLKYSGQGPFEVRLDGRVAPQVVQSLATPLTLLRTHSPTLEDAYLRILARE